ncbi:DUF4190 domain-containing protein [Microbacterium paraoxydans]|uniref:DUF4190 domain-containing protein n=1 Tax=Microbacterium paraoxydans TaxID=199592 RepID=A0ABS5IPA4_9MICO|nr:DUF4190 domain-containing protein [Microbacterium paraoxydans]MBS0024751.1 DUF4190 domain-containing protein [Microbacterium paraoxydans]
MSDPRTPAAPQGEQPLPPPPSTAPATPTELRAAPVAPPAYGVPPSSGAAPGQNAAPVYGAAYGSPPAAYTPPPAAPPVAGPAPAYAPAPPRPTSGLAITSLVCGLVAVVLFWAVIPMLASIAAVITGHLALGQIRRTPGLGGRGIAIAGLILGYVVIAGLLLTLISTVASLLLFGAFTLPFLFAS